MGDGRPSPLNRYPELISRASRSAESAACGLSLRDSEYRVRRLRAGARRIRPDRPAVRPGDLADVVGAGFRACSQSTAVSLSVFQPVLLVPGYGQTVFRRR